MIRYLLDTNVLSEPIRPVPDAGFVAFIAKHEAECAIASVTWQEAVYGMERLPPGRRRDAIRAYLYEKVQPSLPILPYDSAAAEWHGRERARLVAAGRTPSFPDGQIAATARTRGLIVVTANHADFQHYEGLEVWKLGQLVPGT